MTGIAKYNHEKQVESEFTERPMNLITNNIVK